MLLVTILLAASLAVGLTGGKSRIAAQTPLYVATARTVPDIEATQTPGDELALVTFLNPFSGSRTVQLRRVTVDGSTALRLSHMVRSGVAVTTSVLVGVDPETFEVSCSGCITIRFAVAAGQRALLLTAPALDAEAQAATIRSEVQIVNESGRLQRGTLRTGVDASAGRSVARFDLRDGESLGVGMRFAGGQMLDFVLTCDACVPQTALAGNGVILDLVIR